MKLDVNKMTLKELNELNAKLPGAIEVAKAKEAKVLREQFEHLCTVRGFAFRDIVGPHVAKSHPSKGSKLPIKFRGPNGEAWTGRGRPPKWFKPGDQQRVA